MEVKRKAYIEIIEPVSSKDFRFRYESERRTHGSILGANSTATRKTFPKIKIHGNYKEGHVIVSCVTKDQPYRAHPHHIVSKDAGASRGVFTVSISPDNNEVEFKNLGIQCVKQRDIKKSLEDRKTIRVDPFRQGFDHSLNPTSIDLNVVRLCFQVLLVHADTNSKELLDPVVSDPIYDRQSITDLVIVDLSPRMCSVAGGDTLIVFCQKVAKDDIQVRFYEERDGRLVWEAYGSFESKDVLEQAIIMVTTPPYHNQVTEKAVSIWIQLIRPSTGEFSKPAPFELLPRSWRTTAPADTYIERSLKRKRENFKRIDISQHPYLAPCGCILAPIINPDCPVHNPKGVCENKTLNREYKDTWTNYETRPKLFYYDENFAQKTSAYVSKKLKYSVELAAAMTPTVSGHYSMYNNANALPRIHNKPGQYGYQQIPEETRNYQASSQTQCMYDYSVPRNTAPAGQNIPGSWQMQSEPVLEPIIIDLSQKDSQGCNNNDDYLNQNLMDSHYKQSMESFSDSLKNVKISEEYGDSEPTRNEKNINTGDSLDSVCRNVVEEILALQSTT